MSGKPRNDSEYTEELKGRAAHGSVSDIAAVLRMLDKALEIEVIAVMRYRRHYSMSQGAPAESVRKELLLNSGENQMHADQLAARIVELGGSPNFNPVGLAARSNVKYGAETSLLRMLQESLVAERAAIHSYRYMIHCLRGRDDTTRRLLENILVIVEEHTEELVCMMQDVRDMQSEDRFHSGPLDAGPAN